MYVCWCEHLLTCQIWKEKKKKSKTRGKKFYKHVLEPGSKLHELTLARASKCDLYVLLCVLPISLACVYIYALYCVLCVLCAQCHFHLHPIKNLRGERHCNAIPFIINHCGNCQLFALVYVLQKCARCSLVFSLISCGFVPGKRGVIGGRLYSRERIHLQQFFIIYPLAPGERVIERL